VKPERLPRGRQQLDALGHADPRTTRRHDRNRHNLDRSPTYLLARSLITDDRQ
jgi:hypothetical protein